MLRTNWIFREIKQSEDEVGSKNDFLELIDTLDNAEDKSLYTTEFVEALIEQFWALYIKLFNWIFVPFVIQTISIIIFLSYYIKMPPEESNGPFFQLVRGTAYITTFYFGFLEYLQIKSNSSYFFEFTNWNDIGSLVAYLYLMI